MREKTQKKMHSKNNFFFKDCTHPQTNNTLQFTRAERRGENFPLEEKIMRGYECTEKKNCVHMGIFFLSAFGYCSLEASLGGYFLPPEIVQLPAKKRI